VFKVVHSECSHVQSLISEAISFPSVKTEDDSALNEQLHILLHFTLSQKTQAMTTSSVPMLTIIFDTSSQ